jgi:hypothetical protein
MTLNPRQLADIALDSREPAVRRVAVGRLVDSLESVLGELEVVECDIRPDRTWAGQFHCAMHGAWFRYAGDEPEMGCPVSVFARRIISQASR